MLAHAMRITRHAESFIVTDVGAGGDVCAGTDTSAGDLDAAGMGGGAGSSCSNKRRCLAGQRKLAARGLLVLLLWLLLLLEELKLFFRIMLLALTDPDRRTRVELLLVVEIPLRRGEESVSNSLN